MIHRTGRSDSTRMQALAASVIIEACLGVILAWPTILTERASSAHLDVSVQLRWIHSLTLVAFAMSAVAAGKLLDRINPGLCVRAGGVALGVGIAAAGADRENLRDGARFRRNRCRERGRFCVF